MAAYATLLRGDARASLNAFGFLGQWHPLGFYYWGLGFWGVRAFGVRV